MTHLDRLHLFLEAVVWSDGFTYGTFTDGVAGYYAELLLELEIAEALGDA